MTTKTTNKIALITGGSRGLGKNTALALAKHGVDVLLTYHSNQKEADATVAAVHHAGRKAAALQLDAGQTSTFDQFAADVKKALTSTFHTEHFDYLVNNAGTGLYKPFIETTEAEFDAMVNVHLKGVFFLTQKLLPVMNDGGRIVNLSSGLARFSFPGYSAYASMKGAIDTLTRYLAKELGPRGITVNTVAPGAIETDFGGGAVRDNKDMNKMIAGLTALGRAGVPDDIGPMIASLLADENRWVNGQKIEVTGGIFL